MAGETAPIDGGSLRAILEEVAPQHAIDAIHAGQSTLPPESPVTSPGRVPLHTIETDHLPSDFPPPDPFGAEGPPPRETNVLDRRVEAQLDAERYFRRAQSALDRGRAAEAVLALTKATELCPDEGRFLVYLGWAKHAEAPDDAFVLSEALDLAERGVERAPELAIGHLLRARLLRAAGRDVQAREAFDRVLELDPSNEEAAIEG
jgi:tetratricopeptide (TPR) repeat protein